MNFSFYIFGNPSNKYNQYPLDHTSSIFQEVINDQKTETQLSVIRENNLFYYVYTNKLSGSHNNFLGLCLVFNGVYTVNNKKLYESLDNTFSDIVLKGDLIKIDSKGKVHFVVNNFFQHEKEFVRINQVIENKINIELVKDFKKVDTTFKIEKKNKTLSIHDNKNDIFNAIHNHNKVFLFDNNKTESELDRIHKTISNLSDYNQSLTLKYNELKKSKNKYKLSMILSVLMLFSLMVMYSFKKNLVSKNNEIINLKAIIDNKNDSISYKNEKINKIEKLNKEYSNEISSLKDTVYVKENIIMGQLTELDELKQKNESLEYDLSSLNSTNYYLRDNIQTLNRKNQKLTDEINSSSSNKPITYKVVSSNAYTYSLCSGNFEKNNCYYNYGSILYVYYQNSGYGLTVGGYIKMSDLSKY